MSPGLIDGPDEVCRALVLPLPRLLEIEPIDDGVEEPNNVEPTTDDILGVLDPTENKINFY